LEGITRDSIERIANDSGIKLKEEVFSRDELYIADEAFFCGTAAEITPIREVDNRIIGDGARGPITKKLQETFFDIVKGKTINIKSGLHIYKPLYRFTHLLYLFPLQFRKHG